MTPPSGPATTYSYDQADRLVGVSGPTSATYSYNGDGLRVSKTVDGTSTGFVWDTVAAMPVIVAEDDTYYLYGPDALPLARVDTGEVVYYHLDHQGSVRMLTDADGEVVATYSYDPYGNLEASTGTVDQPLGYTGQYLDAETGLYQLRARYYDPTTGQFLTVDPLLADTGEPYTYAGNDPVNFWDPEGLCRLPRGESGMYDNSGRCVPIPRRNTARPNNSSQRSSIDCDEPRVTNQFGMEPGRPPTYDRSQRPAPPGEPHVPSLGWLGGAVSTVAGCLVAAPVGEVAGGAAAARWGLRAAAVTPFGRFGLGAACIAGAASSNFGANSWW